MLLQPGATLAVICRREVQESGCMGRAMLAEPGMLTVVVLPTVALAIDQERQMVDQFRHLQEDCPRNLRGMGRCPKRKEPIRQRLREGTQRVLFASPEAVTGSLCRELFKTAEAGRLKYFVIDESPSGVAMGTEFRPEFQSMSGLRRELIACCAQTEQQLRTLLLSATLTQESIDGLRDLFFRSTTFRSHLAVHLRPEPEY